MATSTKTEPAQLFLLRDSSGAGKTTLAVQMALDEQVGVAAARAAIQPDLDDFPPIPFPTVELPDREPLQGDVDAITSVLNALMVVDQPLLYIIDSLDETRRDTYKEREVLGLIRGLDWINWVARRNGLLAFPIGLIFTVREDYWERWARLFEGRTAESSVLRYSKFTSTELDDALNRYAAVYEFKLPELSTDVRDLVALPFNLQVFSEAHAYQGELGPADTLTENVLALYFNRKQEEIGRRQVQGLTAKAFIYVLSALAWALVRDGVVTLSRARVIEEIGRALPALENTEDELLLALLSEQVIMRDPEATGAYRLRHSRFLEYLVGYYIVWTVSRRPNEDTFASLQSTVGASPITSVFRVHDAVRHITRTEYPDLSETLENFYASSQQYMSGDLTELRAAVGHGGITSAADLALIYRSLGTKDPDVTWSAFFVLAAKKNRQSGDKLVGAFIAAWTTNLENPDRYKLVQKMADRDELLNEAVVERVLASDVSKEWEVFLGNARMKHLEPPLRQLLADFKASGVEIQIPDAPEWAQVRLLLGELS